MSAPARMNLTIELLNQPTALVVKLKGEVGNNEVDFFKSQLMRILGMRPKRVVFDLIELYFIASAGMGAFASFRRSAVGSGAKVFLAAIPAKLEVLIQTAGLNQLYTVCPTVEAALAK
ncbi:MAG: STAS domain-containing protein [Planctomycetia bacterium]|nr:STAS domain-containing protein [Planctomycetia bacterium]